MGTERRLINATTVPTISDSWCGNKVAIVVGVPVLKLSQMLCLQPSVLKGCQVMAHITDVCVCVREICPMLQKYKVGLVVGSFDACSDWISSFLIRTQYHYRDQEISNKEDLSSINWRMQGIWLPNSS